MRDESLSIQGKIILLRLEIIIGNLLFYSKLSGIYDIFELGVISLGNVMQVPYNTLKINEINENNENNLKLLPLLTIKYNGFLFLEISFVNSY